MSSTHRGKVMFIRQRIDKFVDNFPKQFGENFRGYLKRYEKGEATKEEIVGVFTSQIETACNTIDAFQGKLDKKL